MLTAMMNRWKTRIASAVLVVFGPALAAATESEPLKAAPALITSLLETDVQLQGVPFSEVILNVTGKRVLPFTVTNAPDRDLLTKISGALDRVLSELNRTNHPAHRERRINEVSVHFEQALREALNRVPGFACEFPKTAAGRQQRSGYPDLRLVDKTTDRVIYLDPKLFERGSRGSSLRTFYYEPKRETNKVLDDAHHLLIGFEHAGKMDGHWQFLGWELVDLAHFRVRLKAEFQGSNRDLYRPEAVVSRSRQ